MDEKYIYISLGHNCTPATHYVKNKIMKTRKEGRKSCPFDLMISTYTGLCNLFESDFQGFLNIEIINNIKSEKIPEGYLFFSKSLNKPYDDGLIVNKKLGLYFNHESPGNPILYKKENWESRDMFSKENFKNFNIRYTNRIKNLQKYIDYCIDNNQTLVFLMYTWFTPIKLRDIIKKKYPKLKFIISCQKADINIKNEIEKFENYCFCYEKIKEIPFDPFYKDKEILMNSWKNINNIEKLEL